jgi:hypothetical protein
VGHSLIADNAPPPPMHPAILQVACQPLQGGCSAGARHQWASGAVPIPHPAVALIRSPVSGCTHPHVHPVETQCTGHWQSATHFTALHVLSPASHCCMAGVQCPLYLSSASSTQRNTACTYGVAACKAAARLHLPPPVPSMPPVLLDAPPPLPFCPACLLPMLLHAMQRVMSPAVWPPSHDRRGCRHR